MLYFSIDKRTRRGKCCGVFVVWPGGRWVVSSHSSLQAYGIQQVADCARRVAGQQNEPSVMWTTGE